MKILETTLKGLLLIEDEPKFDDRGSFTELFNRGKLCDEMKALDLWVRDRGMLINPVDEVKQVNSSMSLKAGTIRGMHWQGVPHGQTKLIRCMSGGAFDVAVDIRQGSPTYGEFEAFSLKSCDGRSVYIPEGFAHGWQAMQDYSSIMYIVMGCGWVLTSERGIRPNDLGVGQRSFLKGGIPWPLGSTLISDRDLAWPSLERK